MVFGKQTYMCFRATRWTGVKRREEGNNTGNIVRLGALICFPLIKGNLHK